MAFSRALWIGWLFAMGMASQTQPDPGQVLNRALLDFQNGRIVESVAGFDTVVRLRPDIAPGLWQRGIGLYYAGRYEDCRDQFELHRTVNPNDVENAVWHFICVARIESFQAAREALLPVGPDSRVPMREVYEMFRGTKTPEEVLLAAGDDLTAEFYAHLYLGLYFEALGDAERAAEHIRTAAEDRYAGSNMYVVARVHSEMLR